MMNFAGREVCFKNEGLNEEKLRQKRSEEAVQLRKMKREMSFNRQRNLDDHHACYIDSLIEIEFVLQTGDHGEKIRAIRSFANLCRFHIEAVEKTGTAKMVLELLTTQADNPTMQNDIIICFINATALLKKLPAKVFAENRGMEVVMEILSSTPYNDVRENILILLDNLVLTSSEYRDIIMGLGVLAHLLSQLESSKWRGVQLGCIELLAHLTDELVSSDQRMMAFKCCFPILAQYLHHNDAKILEFTLRTLDHLSIEIFLDEFIDGGFCPQILQILGSKHQFCVISSALDCIATLSYQEKMCHVFVSLEIFKTLAKILKSPQECFQISYEVSKPSSLVVNACFIVGNILKADPSKTQLAIDAGIFLSLVTHMKDGEFKLKKSAVRAMSQASVLNVDQAQYLSSIGCIPPLCHLLTIADPNLKKFILKILRGLLWNGDRAAIETMVHIIEECEGKEKIEQLQYDSNDVISDIARDIVTWFFDGASSDDTQYEIDVTDIEMDSGYGLSLGDSRFEF